MSFRKVAKKTKCCICSNDDITQEKCRKNIKKLEDLEIKHVSCHEYIGFPEASTDTLQEFRVKHRNIWLQHRADKSGDPGSYYTAATWHVPLKVLLRYSANREKSERAKVPWSMSKKDGHYYDCDSSLLIPSGLTSVAGTERYFFVAPIVTDERFGVDVLQLCDTPTKGTKEGGMSTRSNSTEASGTNKRQLSPDRIGGRAKATGSLDRQRQRRK